MATDIVTVRLPEVFDLSNTDEIRAVFGSIAGNLVVADFTDTWLVDSTAWCMLLRTHQHMTASGTSLVLCGMRKEIIHQLNTYGFDKIFTVFNTLQEVYTNVSRQENIVMPDMRKKPDTPGFCCRRNGAGLPGSSKQNAKAVLRPNPRPSRIFHTCRP